MATVARLATVTSGYDNFTITVFRRGEADESLAQRSLRHLQNGYGRRECPIDE